MDLVVSLVVINMDVFRLEYQVVLENVVVVMVVVVAVELVLNAKVVLQDFVKIFVK